MAKKLEIESLREQVAQLTNLVTSLAASIQAHKAEAAKPEPEKKPEPEPVVYSIAFQRVAVLGMECSLGPITVGQWNTVMVEDSYQRGGDPFIPVTGNTVEDITEFCMRTHSRLPTETEWTLLALGGGKNDPYDNLDDIAWYDGNSENTPHPICEKKPNGYGLYDMVGNVWELTSTMYPNGKYVRRGSSFNGKAEESRIANRFWHSGSQRGHTIGFRVVRDMNVITSDIE